MTKQLDLLSDGGRIVPVAIEERMEQAFLDYAMSVIVGRALPDVRDGLKPVQRRILYSMWESRLLPDRPYRKCASIVGETMKKYHPHGDASIYEALVRMAQDFSSRDPLVDGHGNFGSVDGDPPAAMRYTEARLSAVSMALLEGIEEDTVGFADNYDGYEREPVVLPARVPNLLVNGAAGIAVGMATAIPPHNLGEVVDAALHLLANPEAGLDELMRHLPAPDFPTGARILATPGIREAYASGRGAITVEAVVTSEVRSGNLPRLVVTEIPYQVNKAALLEKMAALVQSRKLEEIRDLRDESSRTGMRVVIELKRGEDPARVLEKLYALTDLRTNFNANVVALVDGAPRTLSLRECLLAFLAHQRTVLTRRTTHRRDKAAARAHLLEGLLTALDHLDEVIALIRRAASADAAKQQLIKRLRLTDEQAQAVLDMQLRRLARLERGKLKEEHRELRRLIVELEAILSDPSALDGLLAAELKELRRAHATPRRSRIVSADLSVDDVLAGGARAGVAAQSVTVYVTAEGTCRVLPQRRTSTAVGRGLAAVVRCSTHDRLLLVDAQGGGYRLEVADLRVGRARDAGIELAQLLGQPPAAPLVAAVVLPEDASGTLVTLSARGQVKRTALTEYASGSGRATAAGVKDADRIVAAVVCGEDDHLMLAHEGGLVVRFHATEVRPTGPASLGVAGLQVPAGKAAVSLSVVPAGGGEDVVTLDGEGRAKRTPAGEYPAQGRGGKGVKTGAETLVWCGVATSLHVQAERPVVLVTAELVEARRAQPGRPVVEGVRGGVPERAVSLRRSD